MARKTFYPTWRRRLGELTAFTQAHRDTMEAVLGFSSADKQQVSDLLVALNTAQAYFDAYVNVP